MSHGLSDTILKVEDFPATWLGRDERGRVSAGIDIVKAVRLLKHRLRASHQREALLYAALIWWGYHDNDCPAWEKGPCMCGWSDLPKWFRISMSTSTAKHGKLYFEAIRKLVVRERRIQDGSGSIVVNLKYLRAQHDQLVQWLEDLGQPLTDEMKDHLRMIREHYEHIAPKRSFLSDLVP